jgi:hypothetical protein
MSPPLALSSTREPKSDTFVFGPKMAATDFLMVVISLAVNRMAFLSDLTFLTVRLVDF